MKKFIPVIIILLVLALGITIYFIIPKNNDISSSSLTPTSNEEQTVTVKDMISKSNAVLIADIIGSDTKNGVTIYTLSVDEMLKGNNITGLGYLHLNNNVKIEIGQRIIIFSNSDKKYNYKEPFSGAPFVLLVSKEGNLSTINGIGNLEISDTKNASLDFIRQNLEG